MSTDDLVLTADRTYALDQILTARGQRQTIFWLALASAAVVHAVLILGAATSAPRTVGDPRGSQNAIDVELVDASELTSGLAAAAHEAPPPPAPPQPATEAEVQQPEPQPQPEPPQPEEAAAAEPEPTPPALPEQPAPAPEPAQTKPAPEKSEANPAAKPKPKPAPQLDLSVPWNLAMQGTSGDDDDNAASVRPPGITRSGENDRFGRDVIRALKKTMPPSYGTRGRLTVRIILNERGNVAQLQLVEGVGKRELDQDVLFSVRQASFPFPPKNSTLADRTFLVTYVYR